jgi:hypothetical protein
MLLDRYHQSLSLHSSPLEEVSVLEAETLVSGPRETWIDWCCLMPMKQSGLYHLLLAAKRWLLSPSMQN